MNHRYIISLIDHELDVSIFEADLLKNKIFLEAFSQYLLKACNNQTENLQREFRFAMHPILKRFRAIKELKKNKISDKKNLFVHLLKQKEKDNFKELDNILRKWNLQQKLNHPISKFY